MFLRIDKELWVLSFNSIKTFLKTGVNFPFWDFPFQEDKKDKCNIKDSTNAKYLLTQYTVLHEEILGN